MTLQADEPDDALDPTVADYLIGVLLAALPAAADEAADRARRNAVRVAFQSMRPRNPREAMLAAEAIGSHHVIMDCYRLALSPDAEPAAAARAQQRRDAVAREARGLARARTPAGPDGSDPPTGDAGAAKARRREADRRTRGGGARAGAAARASAALFPTRSVRQSNRALAVGGHVHGTAARRLCRP